jgi:hypothetical protein
MPAPSAFDQKVYKAMERPDYYPDEFKTWLPRFLRYLSALQIGKQQIPGIMGEIYKNAEDLGGFLSPWRHFAAAASAYGKVRVFRDYIGIVHIEGVAETTGTPGSASILNLPSGYRPVQQHIFEQAGAAPSGTQLPVRVEILATGDVQVQNPGFASFTSGSWVSLSGIHYRAG